MLGSVEDDAIRALVTRLSRADASGDHTIERAAIAAAGSDLTQVVDWILAHGGRPEAAAAAVPSGGLHGRGDAPRSSSPARYVLPGDSLA